MAKRFEISKSAALRFVSGEALEDAITATRQANGMGMMATIDHLGESIENEDLARKSADVYMQVLERIAETGVDGGISVKLTQLGLAIDYDLCLQNLERIVRKAAELNIFVRVDMEDSPYTQKTLDIFRTLRKKGMPLSSKEPAPGYVSPMPTLTSAPSSSMPRMKALPLFS